MLQMWYVLQLLHLVLPFYIRSTLLCAASDASVTLAFYIRSGWRVLILFADAFLYKGFSFVLQQVAHV